MSVYIPTILLVTIFSLFVDYTSKSNNKLTAEANNLATKFFFILSAIILILVSGLRWEVGTDYWSYARGYSGYVDQFVESILTFNEPGIRTISFISSVIYDDSATMFFIASFITVGLSVWTIYKYSDYYTISILLYIFIGAWHGSFNGINQYLSCAVIFAGHHYIIDRKFWKYFLIILLATAFHTSAFIMVFLYFVPIKKIQVKQIVLLLLLVAIILNLYQPIFELTNSVLVSNNQNPIALDDPYLNRQVSIFRVLVMVAPALLYIIMSYNKKLIKEDYFYINMLFVNAAVYLATSNSAYIARFTIYTTIFICLGIPKILKRTDKKLALIVIYIILILYFLYWSYDIIITDNLVNFQWIFER